MVSISSEETSVTLSIWYPLVLKKQVQRYPYGIH